MKFEALDTRIEVRSLKYEVKLSCADAGIKVRRVLMAIYQDHL